MGDQAEAEARAAPPVPAGRIWRAHGLVLLAWAALAAIATLATPRSGDALPVPLLVAWGAGAQLLLSPTFLLAARLFGPLGWRKLAAAHGAAVVVGFGPLLLLGGEAAVFLARTGLTQRSVCRDFAIEEWRVRGGSGEEPGALEVRVRAQRAGTVRLSFVMLYAADGAFSALEPSPTGFPARAREDEAREVRAGESILLTSPLEPERAETAWYQFALCTKPGDGTDSCGWFGYGRPVAGRGGAGRFCPLPPPAPRSR